MVMPLSLIHIYIEAGSYIEIFFPKHNVRYIAVTDGVDSLTPVSYTHLDVYKRQKPGRLRKK